eukprot:TRINITY_DN14347_c0_g1_i1.p1 TRINITY_DN14347_c0_g1~~TRINITY_DN14347_c0_g1_i1.p1  ORF type:complete len:174 (-),score=45.22 TRINITY_DN14347_c0_g1_i1:60-554(-)
MNTDETFIPLKEGLAIIEQAFRIFDPYNHGTISFQDASHIFHLLGLKSPTTLSFMLDVTLDQLKDLFIKRAVKEPLLLFIEQFFSFGIQTNTHQSDNKMSYEQLYELIAEKAILHQSGIPSNQLDRIIEDLWLELNPNLINDGAITLGDFRRFFEKFYEFSAEM